MGSLGSEELQNNIRIAIRKCTRDGYVTCMPLDRAMNLFLFLHARKRKRTVGLRKNTYF